MALVFASRENIFRPWLEWMPRAASAQETESIPCGEAIAHVCANASGIPEPGKDRAWNQARSFGKER
jgi:hypothetical protein